ncbi:MAG: arsenate reductase family protein [Candidatus Omnitrophica bacterium]|nr:arsenate reductase family protein [Candidatus Omnitrophota bacterium]MCA9418492.1 arsenate reductase family protein [Candidatus Omnitrophota bacterium]MCA9436873.1 arsenate reductase family protein [Candidatus Omnitrophota bacterium]MCA9441627.1 arsenate reductase family protein [Candidatus Omnitrophota bacterium]MCB9768256.1 arsenate reductase family protein [Candidatus Omnitrophota bacterium]
MLKIYAYAKCGTCRKALKHLDVKGIDYQEIPIRESPPKRTELKNMLEFYDGDLRRLFNTSGGDYKELKLKDKLPAMNQKEAIDLLASNGNLVKRPFVLGEDFGLVGFKEEEWEAVGL